MRAVDMQREILLLLAQGHAVTLLDVDGMLAWAEREEESMFDAGPMPAYVAAAPAIARLLECLRAAQAFKAAVLAMQAAHKEVKP